VIEMVEDIDTSTCANCGCRIRLGKGDLTLEPEWTHEASGLRSCAQAPQAEPDDRPQSTWEPTTVTYCAAPPAVYHVTRAYLTGHWRDTVMMRLRYRTLQAWRAHHAALGIEDPPHGRMHVKAAWWPTADGSEPRVAILLGYYDVRELPDAR
jgi:hypothetical protein